MTRTTIRSVTQTSALQATGPFGPIQIKVCLYGSAMSGKTSFIRSKLGDIYNQYVPTIGVEVHPIITSSYCINFWDMAGQNKLGGLASAYLLGSEYVWLFCADNLPYVQQAKSEGRIECGPDLEFLSYIQRDAPNAIVYAIGEHISDEIRQQVDACFATPDLALNSLQ